MRYLFTMLLLAVLTNCATPPPEPKYRMTPTGEAIVYGGYGGYQSLPPRSYGPSRYYLPSGQTIFVYPYGQNSAVIMHD